MSNELDPAVGTWYRHLDKGQMFTVVAVDEKAGMIELQHFDGDVEEIELAAWSDMELEISEPPEDWSAPVDNTEPDDTGYSETQMSGAAWREPLGGNTPSATEVWEDSAPEDERDDWGEGAAAEEIRPQDELEDSVLASVREEDIEGDEETESER